MEFASADAYAAYNVHPEPHGVRPVAAGSPRSRSSSSSTSSPTRSPAPDRRPDRGRARPDRRHAARAAAVARGGSRRPGLRQVRAPQPRRQRQGPHRARDRPRRGAPRRPAAGRHDRRGDRRQHRHRPRARRGRARLSRSSASCPRRCRADKRTSLAALGARVEITPNAPLGDPANFQARGAPPGAPSTGGSWPTSSATRRIRACTSRRPGPRSSRSAAAASAPSSRAPARAARSPASAGSCAARCPGARIVLADPARLGPRRLGRDGDGGPGHRLPDRGHRRRRGAGGARPLGDRRRRARARRRELRDRSAACCARRACWSAARPARPWPPRCASRAPAGSTGRSSPCCPTAGIATSRPPGCALSDARAPPLGDGDPRKRGCE